MECRQLPQGNIRETFRVIGLGLGGIGTTPVEEIEAIIRVWVPWGFQERIEEIVAIANRAHHRQVSLTK